jgi:restriction endonuclease S subunit
MRDGWVETNLEGIAEYINGYPFKPADLGETGVPVIRIKQLLDPNEPVDRTETETPERCLLRNGDIVFSWSGTLAVRILNRGPAKLNQHLFRVVEKEGVYKGFIPLIRDHAIEELEEKSHGTTMKHITKQTLLPHKVLLPSLPEQRRIVDLISSLDSYTEALQHQLEAAKRSRNAVLHELLTAGGEEWVETTLGEICTDGLFGDGDWVESKDQDPEGDYRLLQLADIGDGNFLNKSDRWMNQEQFMRLGCTKLEINDVLIARMPDPIGRACLFPEGMPVCATVVDVAIVRTGNETLQKFLVLLINSSDFRTEAFSLLTGTTRQRISRGNLAKITFAIPLPEKQLEIVNLISLFDSEIARTTRVIEEAKQLRSGLLSDLLSGEHEIPASYDKVIGAA